MTMEFDVGTAALRMRNATEIYLARDTSYGNSRLWTNKCFVSGEEDCWSTKHTIKQRQEARARYLDQCYLTGAQDRGFAAYVEEHEGFGSDPADDCDEEEE